MSEKEILFCEYTHEFGDVSQKIKFPVKHHSSLTEDEITYSILKENNLHEEHFSGIKRQVNNTIKNDYLNKGVKYIDYSSENISECLKYFQLPNLDRNQSNSVPTSKLNFNDDANPSFEKCYREMIECPGFAIAMVEMERRYAKETIQFIDERDYYLGQLIHGEYYNKCNFRDHETEAYNNEKIYLIVNSPAYYSALKKYSEDYDCLREKQLTDYYEILKSAYAHKINKLDLSTFINQFKNDENELLDTNTQNNIQECFTVNFGSQYIVSHNVRLLTKDVFNLCANIYNVQGGTMPERLHTAMSLYTNQLHAVVLLVNKSPANLSDNILKMVRISECCTDFHFASYERQIAKIVNDSIRERSSKEGSNISSNNDRDKVTLPLYRRLHNHSYRWQKSRLSANSSLAEAENAMSGHMLTCDTDKSRLELDREFQFGDIYITKHSNLNYVHSIFHLVMDENTFGSFKKNLDSRNTTIHAYRNILEIAISNEISTISLPLLLCYEYKKEMSLKWCINTAELVLKCIKGYLIDLSDWKNHQSLDIQLLLPENTPRLIFNELAKLITQVYRMSNPVINK